MKFLNRNLDLKENTGGGIGGFDTLSEENILQVMVDPKLVSEEVKQKDDIPPGDEAPPAGAPPDLGDDTPPVEIKPTPEQIDKFEIGEDGKLKLDAEGKHIPKIPVSAENEELDLPIPGQELKNKEEKIQKLTSDWKVLGKELGYGDLKDNTYAAFKEAQTAHLELQVTEKTKPFKDAKFEETIADLPVREQVIIRGIRAGLTTDQIEAPRREFNKFKAMDDADLVAANLKGQGIAEKVIETSIVAMTEDGTLETTAKEIRDEIDARLASLDEDNLAEITALENTLKEKRTTALNNETIELKNALDKVDTFMENKVSPKNREFLIEKWKSGEYHESFKDPKIIAEFLMWKEYGAVAMTNLKNKSIEEGRSKVKKDLHNIPPVKRVGGSESTKTTDDDLNEMDGWDKAASEIEGKKK